jgi:hypothetical protein
MLQPVVSTVAVSLQAELTDLLDFLQTTLI